MDGLNPLAFNFSTVLDCNCSSRNGFNSAEANIPSCPPMMLGMRMLGSCFLVQILDLVWSHIFKRHSDPSTAPSETLSAVGPWLRHCLLTDVSDTAPTLEAATKQRSRLPAYRRCTLARVIFVAPCSVLLRADDDLCFGCACSSARRVEDQSSFFFPAA